MNLNRRGSAIVAVIVLCVVFLTLMVWYFQWSWIQGQGGTRRQAVQHALEYAESGMDAAQQYARIPGTLVETSTDCTSAPMPNGRYEYSLWRDTATPNILEAVTTGYYYLARGSFLDPQTQQPAQRAVIRARIFRDTIAAPLIAVPGTLRIAPGTVTNGGFVYANDLIFVKGPENSITRMDGAYYSRSAKRDDGALDNAPTYVVLRSTPSRALQMGYPPRFPKLNATTREYYRNRARSIDSQLSGDSHLNQVVGPPANYPDSIYYVDGDLHVGSAGPVTFVGALVVYVKGNLFIHHSVRHTGDAWVAFLVEKDIHLTEETPKDMLMMGCFIANGEVVYDGSPHTPGRLSFYGSLLAGQGIDLAKGWSPLRRYAHHPVDETQLPLPWFTQLMEYQVIQGKYNQ